ncbi:hypothetical protein KFK09_009691 [Dendrobium nobile]|uniref:Uncharacterized protein n=1 Tax=Dendrobium nobile TaxID=94219 RepID=A0A8T3BK77_DENNO|nr:hypothetical protein KFK09_009691 [Dendrobium nobile]
MILIFSLLPISDPTCHCDLARCGDPTCSFVPTCRRDNARLCDPVWHQMAPQSLSKSFFYGVALAFEAVIISLFQIIFFWISEDSIKFSCLHLKL